MTTFKQIEANRRNAQHSTGPISEEGKQRSRCNAVRHGLTAETIICALEDAADYKAFESAIVADYDAQSAVERELVLRVASLLWRLRRATTMETELFEIQAKHLLEFQKTRQAHHYIPHKTVHAMFGQADPIGNDLDDTHDVSEDMDSSLSSESNLKGPRRNLARCFLRLANLPSYPLDRLSRYEATLWRQAGQILSALAALDRCKPWERRTHFRVNRRREQAHYGDDD
jgi:hypothetical protein